METLLFGNGLLGDTLFFEHLPGWVPKKCLPVGGKNELEVRMVRQEEENLGETAS